MSKKADKTIDLDDALSRIAALEDRCARLEQIQPAESRALSSTAIMEAIEEDPYCRFEVLEHWSKSGYRFTKGQVLFADRVPQLKSFIQSGLRVAVPADSSERISELMAETKAKRELASAAAAAAEAAAMAAIAVAAQEQVDDLFTPASSGVE